MKKKLLTTILAITALFIFTGIIQGTAAPIFNASLTLTQPNGIEFECLASGDEFFNYLHNENGELIIQDKDGWYSLAENISDRSMGFFKHCAPKRI